MKARNILIGILVLLFLATPGYAQLTVDPFIFHNMTYSAPTVIDQAGNINGTTQNLNAPSFSHDGTAPIIQCDGVNDAINMSFTWDNSTYKFDNGISISLWFQAAKVTYSSYETLFGKYNGRADFLINIETDEKIDVKFRPNGAGAETTATESTSLVNDSQWHHLAITYNGSSKNWKTYLDGNLENTNTYDVNGQDMDTDAAKWIFICARSEGVGTRFFEGNMTGVSIWHNYTISQADAIFLNSSGRNYNMFLVPPVADNFTVTLTNFPTFNVTMTNGSSIRNFSTASGTVTTDVLDNNTDLWNITIYAQTHFNKTYINYNVSADISTTLNRHPYVELRDAWDGHQILTFNGSVLGINYNTTNGTLFLPYNSSQNVNVTALNYINATKTLSLLADSAFNVTLYQSVVNITAFDSVSLAVINSFTVNTSYGSFNTTNGTYHLFPNASTYQFNVSATGYQAATINVTTAAFNQYLLRFNLTKLINVTLKKESDQTAFNVSSMDSVQLKIYCEEETLTFDFTTDSEFFAIDCPYDFMLIVVELNDSSYFRTLVPPLTTDNLTWYLIDITDELALESVFQLNDLTGEFSTDDNSTLIVTKYLDNATRNVVVQRFDLEDKATVYLMENELYTLAIRNSLGVEQNLGFYIATSAGTKTITTSNVPFIPDNTIGYTITWAWLTNTSLLRLIYNDTGETDEITFSVYNGTNTAQVLYNTTSYNVTTVTFNYVANANTSYKICFTASGTGEGNLTDCVTFWDTDEMGNWAGWTSDQAAKFQNWIAILTILFTVLSISGYYNAAPGLALGCFLYWFFLVIGWLNIGTIYLEVGTGALCTLMAIMLFINEGRKK